MIRDPSTSSEVKGESLEDSIRTFSSYVDVIIMRSAEPGLAARAARMMDSIARPVPIVNAGSGPDQHPTQALLDIYTLDRSFAERGGVEGKTIGMMGDLARGRTVRSLCHLLRHYPGVRLRFLSPPAFRMREDVKRLLARNGIGFEETESPAEVLPELDALYLTRLQSEYDGPGEAACFDHARFGVGPDELARMKRDAIIMHPLPRGPELDPRGRRGPPGDVLAAGTKRDVGAGRIAHPDPRGRRRVRHAAPRARSPESLRGRRSRVRAGFLRRISGSAGVRLRVDRFRPAPRRGPAARACGRPVRPPLFQSCLASPRRSLSSPCRESGREPGEPNRIGRTGARSSSKTRRSSGTRAGRPDSMSLRIRSPAVAERAGPGTFVHVRCDSALAMRRPMSVMRTEPDEGWFEILFKEVGAGTRLLARCKRGDRLSVLGPIGRGFSPSPARSRRLLLGGGVGIPPILFLAERIAASRPVVLVGSEVPFPFDIRPSSIPEAGLPPGTALACLEEAEVPSRTASRAGLPGSFDGVVTDLARGWLKVRFSLDEVELRPSPERVELFACGPEPMLRGGHGAWTGVRGAESACPRGAHGVWHRRLRGVQRPGADPGGAGDEAGVRGRAGVRGCQCLLIRDRWVHPGLSTASASSSSDSSSPDPSPAASSPTSERRSSRSSRRVAATRFAAGGCCGMGPPTSGECSGATRSRSP